MGYLDVGEPPLSWSECKKISNKIRRHGAVQLVNLYNKHKDHVNERLKWGEEMEYHVVHLNHSDKKAKLYTEASEIITALNTAEEITGGSLDWHQEYGAWMIECVPKEPYNDFLEELLTVEPKLNLRKKKLRTILEALDVSDLIPISLPNFPLLGSGDFYFPKTSENFQSRYTESLYLDDSVICPHPRFPTLTRNIVERRERPVEIYVPLYQDSNTKSADEPKEGSIHLDASGFGMGMCCLQVTLNAKNIKEARYIYDQLVPMAPIMLALSACTPFFKGKLADVDSRWDIIAGAMDDRTEQEVSKGVRPRYGMVPLYICNCVHQKQCYNDFPVRIHAETFDYLRSQGFDEVLARHFAAVFNKDPLVVFPDKVDVDDQSETNHFENFQSTNWGSLRFKPPPKMDSKVGWRVEFRTMDVQITDFENAAYSVFIVLLARMILSLHLNLQIPMSKVYENMNRGQCRDAVLNQKFWFKRNVVSSDCSVKDLFKCKTRNCKDIIEEMTMKELFLGKEGFEGLLGLLEIYLQNVVGCSHSRYVQLSRYLDFIRKRVSGEIPTGANFLRSFILNHSDYTGDSRISERVAYDICKLCSESDWIEELLGPGVHSGNGSS